MSNKIEYVVELALVKVLGPSYGSISFDIYHALVQAHSDSNTAHDAANARFPIAGRLE